MLCCGNVVFLLDLYTRYLVLILRYVLFIVGYLVQFFFFSYVSSTIGLLRQSRNKVETLHSVKLLVGHLSTFGQCHVAEVFWYLVFMLTSFAIYA